MLKAGIHALICNKKLDSGRKEYRNDGKIECIYTIRKKYDCETIDVYKGLA